MKEFTPMSDAELDSWRETLRQVIGQEMSLSIMPATMGRFIARIEKAENAPGCRWFPFQCSSCLTQYWSGTPLVDRSCPVCGVDGSVEPMKLVAQT